MLNNIPKTVNNLARKVVINHPNSYEGIASRKVLNRTADTSVGGAPTLGGLAVMSSDDEEDVSWETLGNVYVLKVDQFNPSTMMDRRDAHNGEEDEYHFLIEPENELKFAIKKHDVVHILIQGLVKTAYEIASIETMNDIPPYSQRYVCNRRNELDMPALTLAAKDINNDTLTDVNGEILTVKG